jgi:phage shock protein PspC (stress-responsive transcriptional regulator)
MKKVMSVNIGGLVFQIDNEAYTKLDGYIKALEKQFQGTEGSEEIIGDIESRIAEIFQDKMKAGRESIRTEDIDEIVRIMGAPKDLGQESAEAYATPGSPGSSTAQASSGSAEGSTASAGTGASAAGHAGGSSSAAGSASGDAASDPAGSRPQDHSGPSTGNNPKRFFRNSEDKLLGGVCSGFATYIDADPLIVRLAFLLAVLGFGMGPVVYLILWIVVPEAKTTSEKLQMKGEKVTIDSIEKAIRKEANDIKKRFDHIKEDIENNPDHPVNKAEKRGRDFFAEAGDSIGRLFGVAVKVFVGLLVAVIFFAILSAVFGVTGGLGYATFLFPGLLGLLFSSGTQATAMVIGVLAVLSIPLIIIAYKSLRFLLGINMGTKPLDALFLVAWVIGLGLVIVVGAKVASEFQREVTYREEVPLSINPVRTIYLNRLETPVRQFKHSDNIQMDGVSLTDDSVFFQELALDIEPGKSDRFALTVVRRARGKNREQAVDNARSIAYRYRERDSMLALSGEYTIEDRSWRGQELGLVMEVPVGKRIVIDERLRPFLQNVRMANYLTDEELYNRPLVMAENGLEPVQRQGQ